MHVQLQQYQGGLLRGYSGNQLEVKGQADVKVTYGRQNLTLPLVVMAGHHRPALLGSNWLSHLHLNWTEIRLLQNDELQQLLAQYVTEFAKTDLMGTNTEIHFFACRRKSHSCTIQRHQALETRWPGLPFQAAFFRRCKTTRVHFMACMAPEGH